ncbi:MAG: hypothetical protein FWE94_06170 [Coriobacteriia bacterium]|nr:hypothetical protein [Coriobacteriia bacterium]
MITVGEARWLEVGADLSKASTWSANRTIKHTSNRTIKYGLNRTIAECTPDRTPGHTPNPTKNGIADRVYVGSDGCPQALKDLLAAEAWLRALCAHKRTTVVIPPLAEQHLPLLDALTGVLVASAGESDRIEVCCNDIGAFARVAQLACDCASVVPTVGRWLARQDTDPQLAGLLNRASNPARSVFCSGAQASLEYAPPPSGLIEHWACPSALEASYVAIFRGILAARSGRAKPLVVEVDATAFFPAMAAGAARDAIDGADITVRAHTEGALVSMFPCMGGCAECPREPVLLGADRFGNELYRVRNLIISPGAPSFSADWAWPTTGLFRRFAKNLRCSPSYPAGIIPRHSAD